MEPLKVGIVGLGWVSTSHAQTFRENPGTEIVAVCSRRKWDPKELAAIYGEKAKLYNDYDEFLNHPDLQVVDICTPHHLHPEQAIAAAKKGKHLMIEKPLALDWDSLKEMRKAVEDAKVKSAVYFELRFIPHMSLVQSILGQNLIGPVHHIEVDYYHGIGPWYGQWEWHRTKEYGRSALLTAGIHSLDALLYFKGVDGKKLSVEEVYAYSTKTKSEVLKGYEYDSTSAAILQFSDGTVGKCVSCVDARQPYLFNIHIIGSDGTIWNDKFWTTKLEGINADDWIELPTVQAESGDVLAHPYGPQVQDFVDRVSKGEDSAVNFEEAFKTHQVAFAIEKSLEEKRPVKLSELK